MGYPFRALYSASHVFKPATPYENAMTNLSLEKYILNGIFWYL